jgi:hypothetical protein
MTNIIDSGGASLFERAVRASLRLSVGERLTVSMKAIVAVEKNETVMTHDLYSALTLILKSVEAEPGIAYEDLERCLSLRSRAQSFSPRSVKNKIKKLPRPEDAWREDGESDLIRSADTSHRGTREPRQFPEIIDRARYRDNGRTDWSEPAPLGLDEQIRLQQLQKPYGVVKGDEWLLAKNADISELVSLALGDRENNSQTLSRLLFHIQESWTCGGIVLTNSPLCAAVIATLKESGALPADHPTWLPMLSSSLFKAAFAAQERK